MPSRPKLIQSTRKPQKDPDQKVGMELRVKCRIAYKKEGGANIKTANSSGRQNNLQGGMTVTGY